MILSDNITTLKQVPIFQSLDPDILELILDKARLIEKETGEYFFRENDVGNSMFVLRTGKVEVTRNWKKRTYHITELGRSACFGEMSIVDQNIRSANVRALSHCEAIEIDVDTINAICQKNAAQFAILQLNLAKEVSRRLREVNDLLFKARVEDNRNDVFYHAME